jgi:hypothetical protein
VTGNYLRYSESILQYNSLVTFSPKLKVQV